MISEILFDSFVQKLILSWCEIFMARIPPFTSMKLSTVWFSILLLLSFYEFTCRFSEIFPLLQGLCNLQIYYVRIKPNTQSEQIASNIQLCLSNSFSELLNKAASPNW